MIVETFLGWLLMIAVPNGPGLDALEFSRAYATQKTCRAQRDEVLAAPRFQGAVVLADCQPVLLRRAMGLET